MSLDHKNEQYIGSLDTKKMSELPRKGYWIFINQRRRCINPTCKAFKTYGAKGIEVEYNSKEFLYWYIKNYPKDKMLDPTVGRINHSENYKIENIEFQERSDNSKERIQRVGLISKERQIICFDFKTLKKIKSFKSLVSASKELNIDSAAITRCCSLKSMRVGEFVFRYKI